MLAVIYPNFENTISETNLDKNLIVHKKNIRNEKSFNIFCPRPGGSCLETAKLVSAFFGNKLQVNVHPHPPICLFLNLWYLGAS